MGREVWILKQEDWSMDCFLEGRKILRCWWILLKYRIKARSLERIKQKLSEVNLNCYLNS